MIQALGEFGASLLAVALYIVLFFGGLWPAFQLADRLDRAGRLNVPGWCAVIALGIASLLALALLFGPAIHILESYSCRSADDYASCMDPPDRDPL